MGSVGDFLLGSPSKSSENSASQSAYQNQSAAQSGNLAYPQISQSMAPTLPFTADAGAMMAALLGLPVHSLSSTNHTPPPSTTPPGLPPVHLPPVAPPPLPVPIGSGSGTGATTGAGGGLMGNSQTGFNRSMDRIYTEKREMGGPVQAGRPYVVGEKRPEVFVPHTNGTIVPSVPQAMASPATAPASSTIAPNSSALNNWANSAGMQFIMGQGTNAIDQNQAAKGLFQSGATGQALQQYGQNLGKTYLDDYMGHLLDYAKLGLGGAGTLAQAGQYSNSASSGSGSSTSLGTGTSKGAKQGLLPGMASGFSQGVGAAMASGG